MSQTHDFRRQPGRLLPGYNQFDHQLPLVFPSDTGDFPTLTNRRRLCPELSTAVATERGVETCG